MNLKHLTDNQLLIDTKTAVLQEREILTKVLWHLAEVERRKLFSPRYKSIKDYAMGELGYPDDQAWRRIDAMFLLRRFPEIEPAIASGHLNLTNICQAQTHFRAEQYFHGEKVSREEQLQTLRDIAGKSTREAARVIILKSSDPEKAALKPETVRATTGSMNEITMNISDETLAKIERLKGLLAHKHPLLTNGQLFDLALDAALVELNPRKEPKTNTSTRKSGGVNPPAGETIVVETTAAPRSASTQRSAGAALKRAVWKRDHGECVKCGSYRALEDDHQIPFALGGPTTKENLRLLCRSCNARAKIMAFGG